MLALPKIGQTVKAEIAAGTGAGVAAGTESTVGSALSETSQSAFRRIRMQIERDISVPAGTKNIRMMMADASASTGREVGLFRLKNGQRVIRLGGEDFIPWSDDIARVIAHTHPQSGSLVLSEGDVLTIADKLPKARSTVIIDPFSGAGARVGVYSEFEMLWPSGAH